MIDRSFQIDYYYPLISVSFECSSTFVRLQNNTQSYPTPDTIIYSLKIKKFSNLVNENIVSRRIQRIIGYGDLLHDL